MCCVIVIDGQKIAKRLAGQIGKEVKVIKELLQEFNMCASGDAGEDISITMAMDTSFLASKCNQFEYVADNHRQEVIEAYLMICRSNEELSMLESETDNAIHFYKQKRQTILDALDHLSLETAFDIGARCLLHELLVEVEVLLKEVQNTQCAMKSGSPSDVPAMDSDTDDDDSEE